ncbi:hypothetical protein [Paraflavitalea speifideaquila]|uniref:hypothetical protein n=1 Tax=Paraflavitalea speifideaquila TaxID=3076558 RepID=UPI0028EECF30|nr:hypothetical protein [Paraflavitalea speifideiaquila]
MQIKKLKPGKDVGVLSHNDEPAKQFVGITTYSADFGLMGTMAAQSILKKKTYRLPCPAFWQEEPHSDKSSIKYKHMKQLMVLAFLLAGISLSAQQQFWQMTQDGGIRWTVQTNQAHSDHIEMSGKQVSAIVRYGVDQSGRAIYSRKLVFPMLRTIPNDTRGNLIKEFTENITDSITIGGQLVKETPQSFYIKGVLEGNALLSSGVSIHKGYFRLLIKPPSLKAIRSGITEKPQLMFTYPRWIEASSQRQIKEYTAPIPLIIKYTMAAQKHLLHIRRCSFP